MMRNILKGIYCALFFMMVVISCKTTKIAGSKENILTLEQVYDSTLNAQLAYKSLSAKFNAKYKANSSSMSIKGNLKILKDSVIWISLSPGLGIEAARLMCTKDSVFILDKINNNLKKGKYEYIKRLWKIDVDYYSLQSILTNCFFIYPAVENEKNNFASLFTLKNDSLKLLAYRKTESSVENLITFQSNEFLITDYLINDVPNLRSLAINYTKGNFEGATKFPGKINMTSSNSGKSLSISVDYTKVEIDPQLALPFKVPSSYKIIVY